MSASQLPPTPSELFGALFDAVQASGIFRDSKTFADAVPRGALPAILEKWSLLESRNPDSLRSFVELHFDLPCVEADDEPVAPELHAQIAHLWPRLTRASNQVSPFDSALELPRPFVVPGGRFRELYYWDSYFTMLGLGLSGRQDLVEDMIQNFGSMIDRYGHIPNGSRTYYLSRSHPPVFYLMAALSHDQSHVARGVRLEWMRREHRFWMSGEDGLLPCTEHRRVVRLADGSTLNRYWDDRALPRDESWAEDVALASKADGRLPSDLWRDVRAAAESGWDFSSRWLAEGGGLESIRTTRLVPVDLNSLLYGLERQIASESAALGDEASAAAFGQRAERRAAAIDAFLWDEQAGHYVDHDLDVASASKQLSAAAMFPLFVRLAGPDQARRSALAIERLIQPWGLCTTAIESGQQWDAPNGWAPLQWIAVQGLRNYGLHELAGRIATGWNALVEQQYAATGQIFEKYDVVTGQAGHGGEYEVEIGFGWTNGVALAMREVGVHD